VLVIPGPGQGGLWPLLGRLASGERRILPSVTRSRRSGKTSHELIESRSQQCLGGNPGDVLLPAGIRAVRRELGTARSCTCSAAMPSATAEEAPQRSRSRNTSPDLVVESAGRQDAPVWLMTRRFSLWRRSVDSTEIEAAISRLISAVAGEWAKCNGSGSCSRLR